MTSEILAQPSLPDRFNIRDGFADGIRVFRRYQRHDPQIGACQVWIGAILFSDENVSVSLEFRETFLNVDFTSDDAY